MKVARGSLHIFPMMIMLTAQRPNSPAGIPPFIGGRKIIWSAYQRKGVPENALEVMVNSISESTLKQYNCSLKAWWTYAHSQKLDIYQPSTSDIISFLNSRLTEGAKYSTLNTSHAAVSLIAIHDVNEDGLISRFMKGVFKKNPTAPKYTTTWDVSPVLSALEKMHPLKGLKLKDAAEKVATLLALTTAQRLQTLSAINIENISIQSSTISIKITERLKTSKPGSFQPDLILPFFLSKPGLCVASAVLEYIHITEDLRSPTDKRLFISTKKPFKEVCAQTVGHWIKNFLLKAGVDVDKFTAYSTRHAAVSAAHQRGVDISVIRRTAGWSENSDMFFKFYNRPIQPPNDQFARAIIN
uniref:XerD_0 protein n=1 Tax=Fopius arisanus TaxID=64838 RepID=A0A0C9RV36_9HYME